MGGMRTLVTDWTDRQSQFHRTQTGSKSIWLFPFLSRSAHSPCEWKRSIFAMCANTYGRRRQIGVHPVKSSQWVPGPFPRDVKLIKLNYVMSRHSLQGGGYPRYQIKMAGCTQTIWMKHPFICMGSWANTINTLNRTKTERNWNGMRTSTNMFTHLKHLILFSFKYDMKQVINPFQMVKHLDPYLLPVFASTTIM